MFKAKTRAVKKTAITLLICMLMGPLVLSAQVDKKKQIKTGESFKNTISKAQELTLNQERSKASLLLVQEIEKEQKNIYAQRELKKALLNLGELFYTEKAQKTFELGRSLSMSEPDAGVDKYQEALSLEPGNLKILKELARGYLYRGECSKALEISKDALLQNPYNVEFFLLRMQAKVCLGSVEDLEAELANPFVEKDPVSSFIDTLKAQYYFTQEKYAQALTALSKVKLSNFPEAYYWRGQIKSRLGQSPQSDYESYVELCKEQKNKLLQKFPQEPRTCKEAKAVEQKLEQLKTESAG